MNSLKKKAQKIKRKVRTETIAFNKDIDLEENEKWIFHIFFNNVFKENAIKKINDLTFKMKSSINDMEAI